MRRNLRVISGRLAYGTQDRQSVIKAAGVFFFLFFFYCVSHTKKALWERASRRGFEGRVAFGVEVGLAETIINCQSERMGGWGCGGGAGMGWEAGERG